MPSEKLAGVIKPRRGVNRKLEGPVFKIAVLYILSFIISTFIILFLEIEMTNLQQIAYYLGLVCF